MVQFGQPGEPYAVARGRRVLAWLHVRVDNDDTELGADLRTELDAWTASVCPDLGGRRPTQVVVTFNDQGAHQVRLIVTGEELVVPLDVATIPLWLRSPDGYALAVASQSPARVRRSRSAARPG